MADLRQAGPEPHGRRLRLFARDGQGVAGHRRHERRPIPRSFDRSGKYLFFTASTDVGLTPRLAEHVEHGQARAPGASTWPS
ncbi:MAG: hypothetical protein MZU91_11505 [Desulfosudis oleivorans]|nr:hypothetical protein [Desulfosudis oleivorans]